MTDRNVYDHAKGRWTGPDYADDGTPVVEPDQYDKLDRDELVALAADRGVKHAATAKDETIRKALRAADAET